MVTEIICHWMGWNDAWYAQPVPFFKPWRFYRKDPYYWLVKSPLRNIRNRLLRGRHFVGTWTGPQRDLICLKRCETNEEANQYLSPSGATFLIAALLALWKAWRLGVPRYRPRRRVTTHPDAHEE